MRGIINILDNTSPIKEKNIRIPIIKDKQKFVIIGKSIRLFVSEIFKSPKMSESSLVYLENKNKLTEHVAIGVNIPFIRY